MTENVPNEQSVKAPPEGHEFYGNQYTDGSGGGDGLTSDGRHSGLTGDYAVSHDSIIGSIPDESAIMGHDGKTMGDFKKVTSGAAEKILLRINTSDQFKQAAKDDPDGFHAAVDSAFRSQMNKDWGPDYKTLNYFDTTSGQTRIGGLTSRSYDGIVQTLTYQADIIAGLKSFNLKVGARNSKQDAQRLQMIHDYAVENGAACGAQDQAPAEEKAVELVSFGTEVKALDGGRVAGYLVTFGGRDLTNEYFAAETDFGEADRLPVMYHHGMDETLKRRRIGTAELKRDEVGLWVEAQLNLRDEYEQRIFEMAKAGKLGWSSGTAQHVADKTDDGRIKQWFLTEASLTPTPAEPKNTVIPLKSLTVSDNNPPAQSADSAPAEAEVKASVTDSGNAEIQPQEIAQMDNAITVTSEDLQKIARDAATEAVKAYRESEPPVKSAGLSVEIDEADRPFKSLAEQARAVKAHQTTQAMDPRLLRLRNMEIKASGALENPPSYGGFLVEPTIAAEILKPMHEGAPFTPAVRKLPVGANSNMGYINGVDETSRVAGSRWGGVRGYWGAEAATMTASQPKFKRLNWELHKLYALMYASDELLADAAQFSAVAQQAAGEELAFLANDAILNGTGAGTPQGIITSGGTVTVSTRVDASNVQHADILAMWQRLLPRHRGNAAWYINSEVEPKLAQLTFTSGTTGILSPYVNYGPDGVMRIMGKPVIVTEFNAALGTAGDILLADMGAYMFWEKAQPQYAESIHVEFLTDQTAFRWTYRCDGQSMYHLPITPYKGSNTQSAFVILSASS